MWINDDDLEFSRQVLELYVTDYHLPNYSCVDVGSGIGRVAVPVLSRFFKVVDVVDPIQKFVVKAVKALTAAGVEVNGTVSGAQDWIPTKKYDAFWLQGTLSCLTDRDMIAFLKRCREKLNPKGVIFVKDNVLQWKERNKAKFDIIDRTMARSMAHYQESFQEAGLRLEFGQLQPNWPTQKWAPFCLFALRPA
jgi:protein N-terminal methyltransferase